MAIPERQLDTWSNQGAVATARATHRSIRTALGKYDNWPDEATWEIYLQGSYKNSTNIYGDSDVDVVVRLNSSFLTDTSRLDSDAQQRQERATAPATYNWTNFRHDVLSALADYYGADSITEGNKAIKVAGNGGRLDADVVVCVQYRHYFDFPAGSKEGDFFKGIAFYVPTEGRWVKNFPKYHYHMGVEKNSSDHTEGLFKPTVRIFKNMRSRMVSDGYIDADTAPSYFIECFLFNVPDERYLTDHQTRVLQVLDWAVNETDFDELVCQNSIQSLFGRSPEQWNKSEAREFLAGVASLWQDW